MQMVRMTIREGPQRVHHMPSASRGECEWGACALLPCLDPSHQIPQGPFQGPSGSVVLWMVLVACPSREG